METESPKWSDVYTESEIAAAIRLQAAKLAKRHGYYEIAGELNLAADCIDDLCEIRDSLLSQIAQMAGDGIVIAGGIERVREQIRASIENLSKLP